MSDPPARLQVIERKKKEMAKTAEYAHLTYGEWYQTVEKVRLSAITPEVRAANAASHRIGNVDDVARCIDCEIGAWNSWQKECWNV